MLFQGRAPGKRAVPQGRAPGGAPRARPWLETLVQIRYFHLRYKVHVFVHCPVFHQVQSTCIFHFYRISMYKVQVHQFWYEIRFWGTKVHVFSSFLSTENKFNGRKGTQLKIQKTFDLTKLSMSKSVLRTSKIPCFCLLGKAIFHSWKSKSFKKTRTLVPFCTSNVLYCTWVKISGTKYSTSKGTSTCIYFGDVCVSEHARKCLEVLFVEFWCH